MEAIAEQLTTINAVIAELRDGMKELKENVDNKFKQLESRIDLLERNRDTNTEEIKKEIDRLRLGCKEMFNEVAGGELDMELVKTIELASIKNKEKIQSNESLSTEMFERIFHNESSLQLKMEQISSTMDDLKTKMASMALESKTLEDWNRLKTETYVWTIPDVKDRFHSNNSRYGSDTFRCNGCEFDIKAKCKRLDDTFLIGLQFTYDDKINKLVNEHGFTTVKYVVKDQSRSQEKKDIKYIVPLTFTDSFGQHNWIFREILPAVMLFPPYMKDDCVQIAITFEPPSIDHSFVSNNGILLWKVDKYKTRKQEQLHSPIWSPSFYTSPHGYRVRIRLLLSSDKPIGVFVYFLTGEHDHSKSTTFAHKTTITLFNQTDPSRNFTKYEKHENLNIYYMYLLKDRFIEETGFNLDDSLILKVVIEPEAIKSVVKAGPK